MMQPVLFRVRLFEGEGDHKRSETALLWMMEALCKVNEGHLAAGTFPPLYKAGVRYIREAGTEIWLDVPSIIAEGGGDCEDLACWRVAELRLAGHRARPYARWRRVNGVYHYHAMVRRFAGGRSWLEDPALQLGMGGPADVRRAMAIARGAA